MLASRRGEALDPYAMLRELEAERVSYVVVGALARVIHGSDEITDGLDITPSMRPKNMHRLQEALEIMEARRVDARPLELDRLDAEREPIVMLSCDAGELNLVARPLGTRGSVGDGPALIVVAHSSANDQEGIELLPELEDAAA